MTTYACDDFDDVVKTSTVTTASRHRRGAVDATDDDANDDEEQGGACDGGDVPGARGDEDGGAACPCHVDGDGAPCGATAVGTVGSVGGGNGKFRLDGVDLLRCRRECWHGAGRR